MSARVPADVTNREEEVWAADMPVIRQGVFQAREQSAEYVLLRPAPGQWVVMALIPSEPGVPRTLIVTDGTSETEAFRRLAQRLHQSGLPATLDAFATDWAMRAPER